MRENIYKDRKEAGYLVNLRNMEETMEHYDPESEKMWDDLRRACETKTQTKGRCCLIMEAMISLGYTHILVGKETILIQYCCYCGRKLQ